jgi:hypothetical protein
MFWTGCGFGLPDVFPSEFRLIARKPLSSVATLFPKDHSISRHRIQHFQQVKHPRFGGRR